MTSTYLQFSCFLFNNLHLVRLWFRELFGELDWGCQPEFAALPLRELLPSTCCRTCVGDCLCPPKCIDIFWSISRSNMSADLAQSQIRQKLNPPKIKPKIYFKNNRFIPPVRTVSLPTQQAYFITLKNIKVHKALFKA